MNLQRFSIKGLTVMVLMVLAIGAMILSVVGAQHFQRAALESQESAISRMVGIAADQAMEMMHNRAVEMAETSERQIRAAVKTSSRSPSDSTAKAELVELLNEFFHQRFATTGILELKKTRVYDTKLNLVAESSEGVPKLGTALPAVVYDKAKGRQGAERLKVVDGTWMSSHGVMHSVLIPVGGLRVSGYLEIVVNPELNLRDVANIAHLPLTIMAPDGEQLYRSENWAEGETGSSLPIAHQFKDETGQLALKLVVLENMERFYAQMWQTQVAIVAGVVVLMALGVFISLWMFNAHLFRPMYCLAENMARCADGDLNIQVERRGLKDLCELSDALAELVAKLRDQVRGISDGANDVASSAEKLSAVTEQASVAAHRQQTETTQVATAINEMAATVQEVATSAVNAAGAAKEADDAAQDGRQVVNETIADIKSLAGEVERAEEVIGRVEKDSADVGAVLDVIRDIAEQTNLLALNAAIEAARAGEQGRGFAVVADEVRTLASRTQESTQEIQQIIERLQSGARDAVQVMEVGHARAQNSVEQAQKADGALNTIASSVATIVSMNDQIASAAEQQSAMSAEIRNNVGTINTLVEETAEGAEETAASTENLAGLANNLNGLISHFKV